MFSALCECCPCDQELFASTKHLSSVVPGLCGAMGGAQASLCCCWERQKLPREFSAKPPRPPPHTNLVCGGGRVALGKTPWAASNETAATAAIAAGGEDDDHPMRRWRLNFEHTAPSSNTERRGQGGSDPAACRATSGRAGSESKRRRLAMWRRTSDSLPPFRPWIARGYPWAEG